MTKATADVNAEKNGGKVVCEYCGTETVKVKQSKKGVVPPQNELQIDHKIPQSAGGSGTPDNGAASCRSCNVKKSNKY